MPGGSGDPIAPYWHRANAILANVNTLTYSTVAEARHTKTAISHAQHELRMVRSEIFQAIKTLRANGRDKRQMKKVDLGFALIFGTKTAKSQRARDREAMKRRETTDLQPYERMRAALDQMILGLDRAKLDIDRWIASQKP